MRRRNTLLLVAGVAIVAALVGWLAGRSIESPESAAAKAKAPTASRITVPVEQRSLSQNVVVRGDVELADSVQIKVDPAIAGGGPAIVTGAPVAEGAQLNEGTVLVEVAERPVVMLTGELPMFRTLGVGSRGDDVSQFEAALARLGFDPGPQDGRFDTATETAVRAWYTQLGYSPIDPTGTEQERLRTAQAAVDAAQKALNSSGLSEAERLQLVGAIDDARATAVEARNNGAPASELNRLDRQVSIAEATYADRLNQDVSGQQKALDDAIAELAKVREQTGVRVPAPEVVFLKTLPRKLDRLLVERGDAVSTSAVAEVSNAAVSIRSAVSAEDRPLLKIGDKVRIEEEGLGIDVEGKIIELADKAGGTGVPAGKFAMRIQPESFDANQLGVNVKLTVPIQSTSGDVLAVPLAALFATADGSAKVEVEDAPDKPTRFVTVKTGLSADGFVEVSALEGSLEKGDRVVVGQDGGPDADADADAESDTPETVPTPKSVASEAQADNG